MKNGISAKIQLVISMFIFGTIGAFVKYIPLPSAVIAMARGFIGALFLLLVILLKKNKLSFADIKKNALPLILSGIFLGINWILLFEAYKHTTVAVATLCYYLAPIFVITVSPFIFKEKLTPIKGVCVLLSLVGMIFVSGILNTENENTDFSGIIFGVGAAVFYACYMISTKKLKNLSSYDGTVVQLLTAAIILLPYISVTQDFTQIEFTPVSAVLLITVGIVHTGIAYALYFNSIKNLKAQTAAIFSYIDPATAILTSVIFLNEKMTAFSIIGGIMILGSAILSETAENKSK